MSEQSEPTSEPPKSTSEALRLLREVEASPHDSSIPVPNLHRYLFRELRLECSSPSPTSANELSEKWKSILLQAGALRDQGNKTFWNSLNAIQNDVSTWLDAYAEASGQPPAGHPYTQEENELYFQGCSALLKGPGKTAKLPFAVVTTAGSEIGHVLWLHLQAFTGEKSALFCHPEFAADKDVFLSSFLEPLEESFQLAMAAEGASPQIVFWSVVVDDGRPLAQVAVSIGESSATGAAYWAFWHLAHDKLLDDGVFVFAEVNGRESSVSSVRSLSAKVQAVKCMNHPFPPTLVVPTGLSTEDKQAMNQARAWAEVREVGAPRDLSSVRSCAVMAAIAYLNDLIDQTNPTLDWRDGDNLKLDKVYQPAQCESLVKNKEDSEQPKGKPEKEERKIQQIETACLSLERDSPILLVGEPGAGKSSAMLTLCRTLALRGRSQLEARQTPLPSVDWPFLCDFETWASAQSDPLSAVNSAMKSKYGSSTSTGGGAYPHRERAISVLLKMRLEEAQRATWLLFDAYDQRSDSHKEEALADRLDKLLPLHPRLVLSSRPGEHNAPPIPGIVHHAIQPLTWLDSFSIACFWLDEPKARDLLKELDNKNMAHVRENPLLLTATAQLASVRESFQLPETTYQLYQQLIYDLASRGLASLSQSRPINLSVERVIEKLERAAWLLYAKYPGQNSFTLSDFYWCLERAGFTEELELYAELFVRCRLIERVGPKTIQFHHATYLEYLAASRIIKVVEREGWNAKSLPIWCVGEVWHNFSPTQTIKAVVNDPRWQPLLLWMAGHSWNPAPLFSVIISTYRNPLTPVLRRIQTYFADFRYDKRTPLDFPIWQLVLRCYGEIDPMQECHALIEMVKPGIPVLLDSKVESEHRARDEPPSWKGKLWKKPLFASALSAELLRTEGWIAPVIKHRRIDYGKHLEWVEAAHHGFSVLRITPCESLSLEFLAMPKGQQHTPPDWIGTYQFRGTIAKHLVVLARKRSSTELLQQIEHCIERAHRNKTDECYILAALLKSHDTSVAKRALNRMETIFCEGEWSEGVFMFGRLCRSGLESDIQDEFFAFLERIIESVIPSKCVTKWDKLDKQLDFLGEMISNWRARKDVATKMASLIHRLFSIEATMFCVSSKLVEFVKLHGTVQQFIEEIFLLFQGIRAYPGTQAGLLHLDYLTKHGFLLPEDRKFYLKPILEDGIGSSCYVYLNVCGMLEEEFGISESEKLAFFSKAADSAIRNESGYSMIAGLLYCLKVSKVPFEESDHLRVAFRSSVISKILRVTSDSLDYYPVKDVYRDSVEDHYPEIFPLIYEHEGWSGLRSKLQTLLERPFFRELHTAFRKEVLLRCFVQSTDSIELLECLNSFVRRRNRPLLLVPLPVLYFLKKVQPIEVTDWKQEVIRVDWYLLESERRFLSEMIVAILRELGHRKWSFRRRWHRFTFVREGDRASREALDLSDLESWE